jgi:hypothetical protein
MHSNQIILGVCGTAAPVGIAVPQTIGPYGTCGVNLLRDYLFVLLNGVPFMLIIFELPISRSFHLIFNLLTTSFPLRIMSVLTLQ